MSASPARRGGRRLSCALAVVAAVAGSAGLAPSASAACSNVEVVFARGSGELPGLGIVGTPFVNTVRSSLPGRSVNAYAVNYLADPAQLGAGAGATDMTRRVKSVAASCPNTRFILGGYSQGASVTDISIGIRTPLGVGQTIPTSLSSKIAAIVVFGNPLRLYGQTINTASPLYSSRAKEYCNVGDPVCAAGINPAAHLTYHLNGSTTDGGRWAAARV